ncbi:50S ribosomal protein L11 methyltransferase [Thermomonas hydrothermalis]|uniref:Ribosomal protein L11 methyltransferase n=1 Tax=Thermomonas hydrothermalis TaxID=213588 RepID=A0A1M4W569_9GAMM|nr:50S ribosomal protein L11 methyltransferase [Thermomonas hydrothermalis]MCL6619233.1 50S ribosomal protein L11 methyltransferase [Thermomonas hydrothermalis]SHE76300.1 ribosomal protein L11 methyltransferase [Thermomonas hydrothermalis]
MSYLQLSLPCTDAEVARYERALLDVGALAVTLQDAHLDAPDEQAIFEPGVGEQPLWDEMTLTALFPGDTNALVLLAALEAFDPGLTWHKARFEKIEDQVWERAWLDSYRPMRFGERLWIVPWDQPLPEAAEAADAAVLRLDPGLAFGSGTHPTTALCLRWLDALAVRGELQGKTVLDVGCGSGILALAALKLGAAAAVGIDNDPQAITASLDNAQRNGLTLTACLPEQAPVCTFPVVVANILASTLDALADTLAARTAPGGRIALSGILAGQEAALLTRFSPWFDQLQVSREEDWMRIEGVRNTVEARA